MTKTRLGKNGFGSPGSPGSLTLHGGPSVAWEKKENLTASCGRTTGDRIAGSPNSDCREPKIILPFIRVLIAPKHHEIRSLLHISSSICLSIRPMIRIPNSQDEIDGKGVRDRRHKNAPREERVVVCRNRGSLFSTAGAGAAGTAVTWNQPSVNITPCSVKWLKSCLIPRQESEKKASLRAEIVRRLDYLQPEEPEQPHSPFMMMMMVMMV
ncbi:uncharacterized protein RSE6_14582 [Rhynchosporium secalis]|uniref:Uncharacterized protein n=1 Tax=Rhynchosporium secalis TaxID=38038 RepID=A0A1E1MVP4_RHYSE|nr:uncharacterized protein RSE6_14582 [Rhynchosporium secalis]